MANQSLVEYVNKMRDAKVSEDVIKDQLIKSGWPETEINEAILPSAPIPATHLIPPPVPRLSMWIGFEYVLLYITMWIWSGALGGIWNYAIDKHISENAANIQNYFFGEIGTVLLQGYLAAILVTYPFFVGLFISLDKQVKVNPAIKNIKARKFLTYSTIVVNFLFMISMLISTIFNFLGASMSTRTIPHLLVNLIISGSICTYLLQTVREDRKQTI